ncbi:hypothetical protein V8B97DRAFT_1676050 [Scleroderma yunnanense]
MSPFEPTDSLISETIDCSPSPDAGAANDPTEIPEPRVSYSTARRRNTPAQLKALQQLFQITSHPSRQQRQDLAEEVGLELRSVTNWFQNRRQTTRRKSRTYKENTSSNHRAACSSPGRSRASQNATSKSPLLRTISLDEIAELSERPVQICTDVSRTPFSPSTPNIRKRPCTSLGPTDLWKCMPSSPPHPQSSPAPERTRFSALPSQSKTFRSLEWACLNARRGNWTDDHENLSLPDVGLVIDGSTCSEGKETLSLPTEGDSTALLSPRTRSEDVEAAITLLEIKARS